MNTPPLKPILKYPGSKASLASWIISHFPPHTQYVEPFAGSAVVFLNKEPANHEVLNDLNSSIVSLFRVIRTRSEELVALIEMTPWSREEYDASFEQTGDEIEDARRFLVRCWQAHGTRLNGKSGWRHRGPASGGTTSSLWRQLPERLLATLDRFKDAELECRPALDIIAEYPDSLLYVDPPYPLSTRHSALYAYEMADSDHIALLDALNNHPGPVVLSGYAHPLYEAKLAHWYTVTMPSVTEKGGVRTEVLWLNPKAACSRQLPLFDAPQVEDIEVAV